MKTLLLLAGVVGLLTGCGASGPNCALNGEVIKISPTTATADHMAAPPGNQEPFTISASPTAALGCPVPALSVLLYAKWANPDPTNISISSASDSTNGLATCLGTTAAAVPLTATFAYGMDPPDTATVSLICK